MSSDIFAVVLAAAAGMSTVLGSFIVFFSGKKNEKLMTFCMGFAAGMMISVSLVEMFGLSVQILVRDIGSASGSVLSAVFLMAGAALAMLIDKLLPHEDAGEGEKKHNDLLRLGTVSALALAVHNFPEGIATFMAGYSDRSLGLSVAAAIALHNIPEGIAVALPVYFGTNKKGKAFLYTLIAGLAEPIGGLLALLLLRPFMSDFLMAAIFAAAAGIMLYISFEELIPSSWQYGRGRLALFALFSGICIMPLSGAFGI